MRYKDFYNEKIEHTGMFIERQKTMNTFVASHPFPTYDEMIRLIDSHPDQGLSMSMFAEYGMSHHAALKAAYESGMDKHEVRKAGELINSLGGMTSMQMNYYVFSNFASFRNSADPDIQYAYKELEYGWDGVGSWVA
jgi:hypothetical protein